MLTLPTDSNATPRLVDQLLQTALTYKASDIHLEPSEHINRIRMRIDGILQEISQVNTERFNSLIIHLKIRANLDIAEKRLPLDGRINFRLNAETTIDCRISSLPTLFGEKIVIRLLHADKSTLAIDQLGMTNEQQKIFTHALKKPQGLIIISGPTGSGKTTTLYTGLTLCNRSTHNIYTVEDPVEIVLEGTNQVPINPNIGFNYPQALKALLRQDPDIIVIGEIRDPATAKLAIDAAQTGHLVLTTLHTKTAAETLLRLYNMGLPTLALAESLALILNQRLLRLSCQHCLQQISPGCENCSQGYRGRTGVFELLNINKEIKTLLLKKATPAQITQAANLYTLTQSALQKLNQGLIRHAELSRTLNN